MIRRLLASAFCAATMAAFPLASSAQSVDRLAGWRAAVSSGSSRLALYSLGRHTEPAAQPLIARFVSLTGGAHRPGAGLQPLGRGMTIQPILSYTNNFNAGVPFDSIRLGGGDFVVTPSDRARAGVIVGAGLSGSASFSYASGSVLRMSASARHEALPAHDLRRSQIALSACAQHLLSGWTWLDGCVGYSRLIRNYNDDLSMRSLSLGPTHLYRARGVDQQVSARLILRDQGDGRQPGIGIDWIGAVPNVGAVGISTQALRAREGQQDRLRQINLSLARPIWGREMRFGLEFGLDRGSRFLGQQPRRDNVMLFTVDAPLTERLSLEAGVGRRNSNLDVYDEPIFDLSFRTTGW